MSPPYVFLCSLTSHKHYHPRVKHILGLSEGNIVALIQAQPQSWHDAVNAKSAAQTPLTPGCLKLLQALGGNAAGQLKYIPPPELLASCINCVRFPPSGPKEKNMFCVFLGPQVYVYSKADAQGSLCIGSFSANTFFEGYEEEERFVRILKSKKGEKSKRRSRG